MNGAVAFLAGITLTISGVYQWACLMDADKMEEDAAHRGLRGLILVLDVASITGLIAALIR